MIEMEAENKDKIGLRAGEPDPVAVLDQSITQGWKGLFPVKAPRITGDESPSELMRKQGLLNSRSMTEEERRLVFSA